MLQRNIPRNIYNAVTFIGWWKGQGLAEKSKQYLPAQNDLKYYCIFEILISIIIYLECIGFLYRHSQTPGNYHIREWHLPMMITFESNNIIIIYTFEKRISFCTSAQNESADQNGRPCINPSPYSPEEIQQIEI